MWPLARRLHHAGVDPHLFGYCAALSSFDTCVARLCARLRMLFPDPARPYVLIGHSLGSVMIRAALVHLEHLPLHVYLLAPPVTASLFARRVRNWLLFRLWAGSMGQQLADPVFMQAIPVLTVPATVYAGNAGIRTGWLPFGDRPNDGLLMLDETRLPGALWLEVRAPTPSSCARQSSARTCSKVSKNL